MPSKPLRVLGIDPGYDRCGVCIAEKGSPKDRVIFSDCIQTNMKDLFGTRLRTIGDEISALLDKFDPDLVAIESLFFNTNQTTAINVAGVRGVIAFLAHKAGKEIREFSPLQAKLSITGYGKSEKQQVISMIEKIVELDPKKRVDDEYDAIAIALTCIACEKVFHMK